MDLSVFVAGIIGIIGILIIGLYISQKSSGGSIGNSIILSSGAFGMVFSLTAQIDGTLTIKNTYNQGNGLYVPYAVNIYPIVLIPTLLSLICFVVIFIKWNNYKK